MAFKDLLKRPLATATDEELVQEMATRKENLNPFPIHLFPPQLKPFISAVVSEIGCDPSHVGGTLLGVLSSCIGSYYTINPTDSWTIGLAVWLCNVGISSAGKSKADKMVVDPLYKIQDELSRRNEDRKRENENSESTDRLRMQEIIVQNATFEAMVKELLFDNPKGLCKHEDELTSWIEGMYRYSKDDTELNFWLKGWSNSPFKFNRTNNKKAEVKRTSCCVIGGTQPAFLAEFFSTKMLAKGFTARLLFNVPDNEIISSTNLFYKFDAGLKKSYQDLCMKLFFDLEVKHQDQEPQPLAVPIDAVILFDNWCKEKEAILNKMSDFDTVPKSVAATAYGKLKEYAWKFAGIMAVLDAAVNGNNHGYLETIKLHHLEAALEITEYYFKSFQKAYLLSSSRLFVPLHVLDLSRLWRSGISQKEMAKKLGMAETTFRNQIKRYMREYPHAFGAQVK
jgi:Protein of unknown function (DUF3987)